MAAYKLTRMGISVTLRWHDSNVLTTVGSATEATAFALTDESGLDLDEDTSGVLWVTYQNSDGDVKRRSSADGGTTWSTEI